MVEQIYREAEQGAAQVPWADLCPNPNLQDFWQAQAIPVAGKTALKIGCAFGDDAEQLAEWGFAVTAFDIAETAINTCRRRFPHSPVQYFNADLFRPPKDWIRAFDFVLESYTLQALPPELRAQATEHVADFVADGGNLLVIARACEEADPRGELPWPLTRRELNHLLDVGLREISFEDYQDPHEPEVRRFRALYRRP